MLAEAKQAVLASGDPTELELELSSERGTRWYDVRVRAIVSAAKSWEP
jgi:hypothetical protein